MLWGEGETRFQAIAEAKARAELMPHSRFEVMAGEHRGSGWTSRLCADRMAALYTR